MKISACIIVKNESKNVEKCLSSLLGNVDQIVVVDTGSDDDTREKVRNYTDKVYDFRWCDDFSKARNFSISKAAYDWIFVIDADEILTNIDKFELSNLKNMPEHAIGIVEIKNVLFDGQVITHVTEQVSRVFNRCYFHYEGLIHEQVVSKSGIQPRGIASNIILEHTGYSQEILNSRGKLQRNVTLLKKALDINQKDPYLHYQLGKTYSLMKDYSNACIEYNMAFEYLDPEPWYKYKEDLIVSYGYTLINIGNYGEVLELEKYKPFLENSADFNFLIALIYMNNAMFAQAVESFLKCTKISKARVEGVNTYKAWYNIGIIYEVLGLTQQAEKYYKRCGNYPPALNRLEFNIE